MATSHVYDNEEVDNIMIIESLSSPTPINAPPSAHGPSTSTPPPAISDLLSPTPSISVAYPSALPTRLRLPQYSDTFRGSQPSPRAWMVQESIRRTPRGFITVCVLWLYPGRWSSSGYPPLCYLPTEIQLQPKEYWFRVKPINKLKKLMLRLATEIEVDPGQLYFYFRGAQINPESTFEMVGTLSLLLLLG